MRLIDLHTDWLLQYANETTVFEGSLYPRVKQRLGQAEGYLQGTWAAILSCYRHDDDWARQADPWRALADLIARIEAEFAGRLLIGPDDVARWRDDPEGLCWGVIGVEGFDVLVRSAADLARLRGLFERGVRLFQPVYAPSNVLAGCSASGDDRGLTDLGRAFLASLFDLGAEAEGPRPMFDLAHLNPRSAGEALDWFEADAVRSRRVIPVYSHGALNHAGFATPRAITLDNLRRLRALGGVIGLSVGPPFHDSTESLKTGIETAASLPFEGRPGFEGIAIGTDFLGVDQTLAGLGNVEGVTAWVKSAFDPAAADAIVQANGRKLILRCAGVSEAEP